MDAGRRWDSIAIAADLSVRVEGTDRPMPADLAATVAAIWAHERRSRPALFNGCVFCADRVGRHEIVGHWTEYRRVLAQIREPALFDALGIRSLAVNGLIECPDGLLLGRRHPGAVYFPGHWQAAPAGSVEARDGAGLDLAGQLLAELEEELGLRYPDVTAIRPVLAIEHAGTRIVDIGFLLVTPCRFRDIEHRHATHGNGEYDRLRVIPPALLPGFLARADPTLMPSARLMLGAWMEPVD